jgi:hypothetical protein
MACNFWWGSNFDKRKIHWVNWKKICKNKEYGGLGFRETFVFNEALLAKQGWKILTQPHSLVARVFKAKYFPKCNFLDAPMGNKMSYTWRSILQARWVLKKGCFGPLVMVNMSTFGRIIGSLPKMASRFGVSKEMAANTPL